MEDFALDIMIGKGPSARSIRIDLAHFTLVGGDDEGGTAHLALAGPVPGCCCGWRCTRRRSSARLSCGVPEF